jgi:hypothetical protein
MFLKKLLDVSGRNSFDWAKTSRTFAIPCSGNNPRHCHAFPNLIQSQFHSDIPGLYDRNVTNLEGVVIRLQPRYLNGDFPSSKGLNPVKSFQRDMKLRHWVSRNQISS